jgi:transcriptional antiterminator Rof (Rho-off)
MKLLAHFLADSANFNQDQTFTVFKGGITEVQAMGFPVMTKFVVVTSLVFDLEEAAKLHHMQLSLTLPDGRQVSGQRQPIAVRVLDATAKRFYSNVIGQMNVGVDRAGEIVIAGEIDGDRLPLLHLAIRRVEVI